MLRNVSAADIPRAIADTPIAEYLRDTLTNLAMQPGRRISIMLRYILNIPSVPELRALAVGGGVMAAHVRVAVSGLGVSRGCLAVGCAVRLVAGLGGRDRSDIG